MTTGSAHPPERVQPTQQSASPRVATEQEASGSAEGGAPPPRPRRSPDLLITFLRGYGMIPVIILHWFLEFRTAPPEPVATFAAREAIPWFGWVIGLWVMPGFFFAAGATSWRSFGKTATRPWLWARLKRLLVPYYVMAVVVASAELVAGVGGIGRCRTFGLGGFLSWLIPFPHLDCLLLPTPPLWFVTAFVIVTLLTPLLYRIMNNRWAILGATVVALGTLAWTTVVLRPLLQEGMGGILVYVIHGPPTPLQGLAFFIGHLILWPAFTMLGFAYGRGTLQRWGRWLIPAGVVLLLGGLVPVAAGIVPADIVGNLQPPSITMLVAGGGALLVLIGIRDWLAKAMTSLHLVRPLDAIARRSYTVYLWHMPPFTLVWWAAAAAGLLASPLALAHPLGRNIVLGIIAAPLLFLAVWYFQRFEQPGAVGRLFRRRKKQLPADATA